MILFLDLAANRKGEINENYARELMELFTLGADRGAYTEDDVRELARSLSGWRYDWSQELGAHNFRWDEQDRWDPGYKTVFGKRGALDVGGRRADGRRARQAPVVLRRQALELLHPDAARRGDGGRPRGALQGLGLPDPARCWRRSSAPRSSTTGPRMVKPPIVLIAGMLRARKRGITDNSWSWVSSGAGQRVYYPPDVAGWDDKRWLDTNTTLRALGGGLLRARRRHRGSQLGHGLPGRDTRGRGGQGARVLGRPRPDRHRRRPRCWTSRAARSRPRARRGSARSARTRCAS